MQRVDCHMVSLRTDLMECAAVATMSYTACISLQIWACYKLCSLVSLATYSMVMSCVCWECLTEACRCVTEACTCLTEVSRCHCEVCICLTEANRCLTEAWWCLTEACICLTEVSRCLSDVCRCLTEASICLTEACICLTEACICLTEVSRCLSEVCRCLTESRRCLTEACRCLTDACLCSRQWRRTPGGWISTSCQSRVIWDISVVSVESDSPTGQASDNTWRCTRVSIPITARSVVAGLHRRTVWRVTWCSTHASRLSLATSVGRTLATEAPWKLT